jgi:aconitate hydratase
MLSLVVSPILLGQALATGSVWLRPPRSVQIHLSGRLRPFVCARDVALELLRRGLYEVVQRIEAEQKAPVVLEFAGPSARLLSVGERAVLCGIAPQVGAAAALFVSDEKTEVFLRDQRRSKAHRALVPDPGAPCEEVVSVDLGTVDPLLLDEHGTVRPVRDLAGQPVSQAVLGGDSGVTLRDMLAAALLLKSKRVPSRLDLLVAPPSRQVLEVLARAGALVDLVATGARILEPDRRLLTGEIYPPARSGTSVRTSDPEPRGPGVAPFVVASAETVAYAVATGAIGDPRSFKRPVRVTVPRALPTDDVLILRDKKGEQSASKKAPTLPSTLAWKAPASLDLVEGVLPRTTTVGASKPSTNASPPAPTGDDGEPRALALLLSTLDEVRAATERPNDLAGVRAVIAPFIPSGIVATLAADGIAAFSADTDAHSALKGQKSISLPAGTQWGDSVAATTSRGRVDLGFLAVGAERGWVVAGTARTAPKPAR